LDQREIEEYQDSVLKEADEAFKYFRNSIDQLVATTSEKQ